MKNYVYATPIGYNQTVLNRVFLGENLLKVGNGKEKGDQIPF